MSVVCELVLVQAVSLEDPRLPFTCEHPSDRVEHPPPLSFLTLTLASCLYHSNPFNLHTVYALHKQVPIQFNLLSLFIAFSLVTHFFF